MTNIARESNELEAVLARYRECLYDAAHARNERERQALETQSELLLKIILELQERLQVLRSDRGKCSPLPARGERSD